MKNARNELEMIALLDEEADIACKRYESFAERVGYGLPRLDTPVVQGGLPHDFADSIDHLEELRRRANDAMGRYANHLQYCREVMDLIPDTRLRKVLEWRYVMRVELVRLIELLKVSDSQCYRLRVQAVDEFQLALNRHEREKARG